MKYKIVVNNYNSGLNELLNSQMQQYNPRTRKMKVWNNEKAKNDKICRLAILKYLRNVKISKPLYIHYKFFVKDMKHDYSNIESAFIKSFEDALQEVKVIKNDGVKDIVGKTVDYEIKRGTNHIVWICLEELPDKTLKVADTYDWSDFGG